MLWFVRVALKHPCALVVPALEAHVNYDQQGQPERNAALRLRTRQPGTRVDLLRALGGGWSAPDDAVTVAAVATTAPLQTTPHEWR